MSEARGIEQQYLDLLRDIVENGERKGDRTGTGTLSLFGRQLRHNMQDGFPLLTTKKINMNLVTTELLWFLEGSGDERRLCELVYGTRDASKKTIWTANAQATSGSKYTPAFEGDLGRVYGVQWRSWKTWSPYTGGGGHWVQTDQIKNLITTLKTNPNDRRQIVTAWNPGELGEMALPPCHMFFQTYVSRNEFLSLQVYIRSNDMFLGAPFNIASYGLLICLLAAHVGLRPGELIVTIGDAHIYSNHIDQVKEQLSREPRMLPVLTLEQPASIDDPFDMFLVRPQEVKVSFYDPHPAISAPMAA